MIKIKSHIRHRSQQDSVIKLQQNSNLTPISLINQKIDLLAKLTDKTSLITLNAAKTSKRIKLKQINSARNSVDNSDIAQMTALQKFSFQNELKKYNTKIKDLGQILSDVTKKIYEQDQKNKILIVLTNLMKNQIQSKQLSINYLVKNQIIEQNKMSLQKEKIKIQKILNEYNKNISFNKKLIEDIENQRKFRILYESYFYLLEKQIKQLQIEYGAQLIKSLQNKFLFLMTSGNDVISNGHVLALRKQDQKQNEKQMNRNTYMCLPTNKSIQTNQQQNNQKRKSSKFSSKKSNSKKLVKILDFIRTSKALESSQLSLYEQDEMFQNQKHSKYSSFRTQKNVKNGQNFPMTGRSILRKKNQAKKGSKFNQRSAKIISLKFITDINTYFEDNFDEVVIELFKLYQALGINIFAKKQGEQNNQNVEDYFCFDEAQLINQSQKRLQYIKKSDQKIGKFNELLQRKISLVEENIFQTEHFISQIQKKVQKQKRKAFQQAQQGSIEESHSDIWAYETVTKLLGINSNHFNSQKEVQRIVGILLESQKQSICQNQMFADICSSKKSSISSNAQIDSSKKVDSNVSIFPSQNTKNSKIQYIKGMMKTQGYQRKFHPLILNESNKEDFNMTSKLNKTCKSIFENGMKSLDNIFDNLKTCQTYQRVFQRQQFEKEYAKQITKKKRVMFRRQARVMPNALE